MTPLEQAKADLERATDQFNRAANSTTPPGVLQKAVRDLMVAVDDWASMRRDTPRNAA